MATTNAANGGNNGGNNGNNNANGNVENNGVRKKRMLHIRKKRESRGPPSAQQQADLAENLLRVDVYFETLSVQNITETPTYNVSKLTSVK